MPEQQQDQADIPATVTSYTTRRSAEFGKMALAMAKAQGAMKGALKDATNPFFQSKYADLASVWDDCRQPLSGNEIAVFQMPGAIGARVTITTLLAHSSGQWLESDLEMRSKDESPQGIGSVISYARRYALAAMTGVYQVDDDAESAQGHERAGSPAEREYSAGSRAESPSLPASAYRSSAMPASDGHPVNRRPGGPFGFGKKHKETPWDLVPVDYLEWALNADRIPQDMRVRIAAELEWRDHERAGMERVDEQTRIEREKPLEEEIP